MRNRVAKMKLIPVHELIEGKKLLFVDDSIVRGTQMRETVEFLYENGAKEVHMRSACPPIMYGRKYLNFSRKDRNLNLLQDRSLMRTRVSRELNTLKNTAIQALSVASSSGTRYAEDLSLPLLNSSRLKAL